MATFISQLVVYAFSWPKGRRGHLWAMTHLIPMTLQSHGVGKAASKVNGMNCLLKLLLLTYTAEGSTDFT